MVVHSHLKDDFSDYRMHVRIEHMNKMGMVSPLVREESLPTSLSDDGKEDSVLEGSKVSL